MSGDGSDANIDGGRRQRRWHAERQTSSVTFVSTSQRTLSSLCVDISSAGRVCTDGSKRDPLDPCARYVRLESVKTKWSRYTAATTWTRRTHARSCRHDRKRNEPNRRRITIRSTTSRSGAWVLDSKCWGTTTDSSSRSGMVRTRSPFGRWTDRMDRTDRLDRFHQHRIRRRNFCRRLSSGSLCFWWFGWFLREGYLCLERQNIVYFWRFVVEKLFIELRFRIF